MTLGITGARHILTRLAFGASPQQIAHAAERTADDLVDEWLGAHVDTATLAPPDWVDEPIPSPREFRRRRRDPDALEQRRQRAFTLKRWWYEELLTTASPLTEQMTLFWHNHFTSNMRKVRLPQLLYRQNALLRRSALGSFREMAHSVAKDPAMMWFLDTFRSSVQQPNENFARELFELFTLGHGNYTETDIREAARAFTGWRIDRATGEFYIDPAEHDDGVKTVLGVTGNLGGEDVIDIALAQPACAELIVRKLWQAFVSPEPNPDMVSALATTLREADYELQPVLRALWTSPEFLDPTVHGTLIKSPVDLLVGTSRSFELGEALSDERSLRRLTRLGRRLGQDLFDPPNVKGWPGGALWINSASLLTRRSTLGRAIDLPAMRVQVYNQGLGSWFGLEEGTTLSEAASAAIPVLLPLEPTMPLAGAVRPRAVISQLLLDPVYQLK